MRRWHMMVALGACLLAALFAWTATRGSQREGSRVAEPVVGNTEGPSLPSQVQDEPSDRPPEIGLEFDDDPIGELRLEGQVIDSQELPVDGALVALGSNPVRELRTEEDGSFVFERLVGRSYKIEAFHDDRYAGLVTVRLMSATEPVILRLKPAASLEVSVVDARNYKPIEAATVSVSSVATFTSTTDEEGKTTVRGLGPGRYRIRASASGFGQAVQEFTTSGAAGVIERSTIALHSGASVEGLVRDPSGKPVRAAKVVAIAVSSSDQEEFAAVTNEKGRWRVEAIAFGTYRFRATHAKHAPGLSEPITLEERSEHRGVQIQLLPGGRVAGQVVSAEGSPVGFAAVRVHTGRVRQAFCDERGQFVIEGLPREKLELIAIHETATSAIETVDLTETPDRNDVQLTLDIDGTIMGRVVNPAGEEIPEAEVRAFPESQARDYDEWSLRQTPTAVTDYGGGFVLRGLPAGAYFLSAHRPGERQSWVRKGLVKAKPGDKDVRILLQGNGSVTGKVLYEDGSVPEIFFVQLAGFSEKTPFSTKDGHFRLNDVPAASNALFVTGPRFLDARRDDVKVDASRTTDVGTIIVDSGHLVRGHVVTEDRSPVAGATVVIQGGVPFYGDGQGFNEGSGKKNMTTNDDGSFSLFGLPRGVMLFVIADHPESGRSSVTSLMGGDNVGIELMLLATGALQGTVTQKGEPFVVRLVAVQGDVHLSLNSTKDGFYRFDRLLPGRYQVNAQPSGSAFMGAVADHVEVEIEPGKTATLNFDLAAGTTVLVNVVTKVGDEVESAEVRLVRGKALDIKTVGEYEAAVAELEEGTIRRSPKIKMHIEVKFENVEPDTYALCAWAVREPTIVPGGVALAVAADDDLAACKTLTIRSGSVKLEETIAVEARPSDE